MTEFLYMQFQDEDGKPWAGVIVEPPFIDGWGETRVIGAVFDLDAGIVKDDAWFTCNVPLRVDRDWRWGTAIRVVTQAIGAIDAGLFPHNSIEITV